MKRVASYLTLGLTPFILLLLSFNQVQADVLTVAVANSTCTAIKEVGALFEKQRGITISYICKSSGRLAKGLKGEVIKADIYISANKSWMDKVVVANLVDREVVKSLWGNSLVVAVPKESPLKISELNGLTSDEITTIMIGDPGTAPFGRYAKQALQSTGIWMSVRNKIKTKKNITLLADSVAESDLSTVGILFGTNVNSGMKVIYTIDESWHKPIRYYSAPVRGADNPASAKSFMKFLGGVKAQKIFVEKGFKAF